MSPIPGEPLRPQVELTTKDGRRVKLKLPGLKAPEKPRGTEQRGGAEPRSDPRAPIDPNVMGPPI